MTTSQTRPGDALSETQRRFLAAVMQRLPRELVHEVYLFAPMKQGGVETGIAVVALGEPTPGEAPALDDAGAAVSDDAPTAGADIAVVDDGGGCDPTDSAAGAATDVLTADDATADEAGAAMEAGDDGAPTTDAGEADEADDVDDVGDVDDTPDVDDVDDEFHDIHPPGGTVNPPVAARAARFTIFTARYRLQLKGPERGKWDVDVVEEADAPLVTVDAVVRGVHRRSGEPSEVERLAPQDLARALGEVPWTSES